MTTRTARAVLAASVALLCVVTAWAFPASGDERVDLVGDSVRLDEPSNPRGGRPARDLPDRAEDVPATLQPPTAVTQDRPPDSKGSATTTVPTRPGVPTALYISSIEVAAPIVPTGLNDDRSMEVPPVDRAGWYQHGVRPGATAGSSVIAAHVDFNGEPGVFHRLAEVRLGERITVADEAGTVRDYQVTERYQIDKNDLPTGELFRRGGPPVLTLVTCGGGFEEDERSYTDNIVVRATPVP